MSNPDWRTEKWSEERYQKKMKVLEKKYGLLRDKRQVPIVYLECKSIEETALRTGYSKTVIYGYLAEAGVKVFREKSCDSNVFDIIDSPDKAYWLGFLSADAYIQYKQEKNNYRYLLSLALKESDTSHIQKFRDFTGSTHKITTRLTTSPQGKKFPSASITITNKALVESLISYGITQCKSQTLKPCTDKIPKEFHRDYWRGFVDGDGTVHEGTNNFPYVGLGGSQAVVQGFCDFIREELFPDSTSKPSSRYEGRMFDARFTRGRALKVAKLLYEGATVYLDRKKERADRMIAALA